MRNIKSTTPLLFVILFFAASTAFSQFADLTYSTVSSDAVRLDLRDDFGGRIAQGSMILSKEEGMITCDGNPIGASWDTTLLTDGWHMLLCNGENIQVCIRNDSSMCLEEGRLVENTVWDNSVVHVVRNNVYVSKGVTLTIAEGTTVKFAEDSRIIVENGGKLQMTGSEEAYVQFAMVTDDGYAGDTDMREQAIELPTYAVINCESSGTLTDNGFIVSQGLIISSTFPSVQLHSALVQESFGEVFLPLTLSGTRKSGFYVEWEATNGTAAYGEDYMLAKGKETWTSTDNGTKFIRIPLVSGHIADDKETFSVRLVSSGGANITTEDVTVTIQKSNDAGLSGLVYSNGVFGKVRLDLRDGFGGRIIRGNVSFSEMEGNAAVNGTNITSPWRSTSVEDGWHELSQGGHTQEVCVLNHDSVALEEGRIIQNTTWDGNSVHLIRNDVYVPNGVTLTLAAGAVVKFTEDTRIVVEHGGKVSVQGTEDNLVQFALANNDAVGGDTDMRETNMDIPEAPLLYCYNGNDFLDNGFFVTRNVRIASLPEVALHNARVFEGEGVVLIAVTISGSRNRPFWLEWEAVDGTARYGHDFTLRRGRVTWNNVSEGTKYIEIPLVTDDMDEGLEYFTVSVISCGGVNTSVDTATVDIDEEGEGMPGSGGNYDFMSASLAQPVCVDARIMPMRLGQEQETVAYSQLWADADGVNSATVTVQQVDTEEDAVLLASSNNMEPEGVVTIDTTNLPSGKYVLEHETMNANGKVLEKLESSFFLNRDASVHDELIQSDEIWTSEKVHIISGDVVVPNGVELIIEDGAVVKFMDGTSLTAKTGGSIVANAVIFTHIADDNAGGDSNLDGDATSPVSDVYQLTGFTTGDACELRYITLTFTGGTISGTKVLQGNRVHKVTGNITVASGGKLIVQAGAVVKMGSGLSITVNHGGTLEAIGNRAQPIVFTSIKDDTYGGDTNGDGDQSMPEPMDWGTLLLKGGYGEFEYCSFMYGAGVVGNQYNASAIVFMWDNGSGSFKNCTIAHSFTDGCFSQQATFENCIFTDCDRGLVSNSSTIMVNNCVFFDNALGAVGHGGTMTIVNSIFYQNLEADVSNYGTTPVVKYSCAYSENQGSIRGGYSKVAIANGVNENITKDPLFTDAANGDFTLKAGSPCIDAGDGSGAPALDYFGQPRQEIREIENVGTVSENGAVPDIGIHEMLPKNAAATVDLVAMSVEQTEESVKVGERLNVCWTLRNDGSDAAHGTWRDYVYIVSENGDETLLGNQTTMGSIAANGLRVIKGTFDVPNVNEGAYYLRVKANLNRDIFEGALTGNNIATSEAMVEISYPKAAVKDGIAGTLVPGDSVVKLVNVEEGYSLALINAPKGTMVYYSLGAIPTEEMYISSVTCLDGETMLSLPTGEVYLLIVAPHDETCDFSIAFTEDSLQIQSVSQTRLFSAGKSFVRVHGSRFSSEAEICLVRGSEKVDVTAYIPGDNDIWITIDNGKLSPGYYDLQVSSLGETATLENAFLATAEEGRMKLSYQVVQPNSARVGRVFTATLEYENTGDVAMPAPIFVLEAPYRNFIVNGETYEQKVMLYGMGAEYPCGYLQPGVKQSLTFQMQITSNSDSGLSYQAFHAGTAGAERTFYLEDVYAKEYLEYLKENSPEEYTALQQAVGKTWREFYEGMAVYTTQALSKLPKHPIVYEDVKDDYIDDIRLHLQQQKLDFLSEASSHGLVGTRGSCSLTSKSRLGGWKGLISDFYLPILADSNQYDYSAKPVCSRMLYWARDFAWDNSYPGQIWWYHASCRGWHRIGYMNTPYDEVIAQISNNSEWYLLCHGNECSIHDEWLEEMAYAIHAKKPNANVFAVDWGDIAQMTWNGVDPEDTAPMIPYVATEAVRQLGIIQENLSLKRHFSLPINGLTIIGHSHGGHLGGIIAKLLGGKPKRLIGLDSSPMWTHIENGNYFYPGAWDSSVAQNVEFYKTSWGFSMGSSDDSEVFGRPSFFVTMNGDFSKDLYSPGYSPKGKLDGGFLLSKKRHGYSHDWLTMTISNGTPLGWNWDNENWSEVAFSNSSVSGNGFYGVVHNNKMELGKNCVEEIDNSHREGQSKVTRDTWRYDALVLEKRFDSLLGLSGFDGLERLWNLWSMLVEYRANFLMVDGALNEATVMAGRRIKINFSISNMADNYSINDARRSQHFNGWNWNEKYPSVVPWSYRVEGVECSIANTVHVYDLHTLNKSDLDELVSDVGKFKFDSLQDRIATCDSALLYSWDGYWDGISDFATGFRNGASNFIDAGSGAKVLHSNVEFSPIFSHRSWNLGRKQNGEVYDKDKGEPFLLVGKAAAVKKGDLYPSEYYPGDLFFGDNIWATIVYVQPPNGELEARLVAANETNGSGGTGNGFVQQEIFEVTTDDDGGWSIELSAAQSICSNGLKYYYWETEGFSPSSTQTTVSILEPIGFLNDDEKEHDFKISLTVCDLQDETDTVEVTIRVRRPEEKCMNCTPDTCICAPGECNCQGCKKKDSKPEKPQSCDPNEMAGMYGFGDSATQRFVRLGEEMTYTIYFENKSSATAAAQEVKVTSQLSKWLDWSRFQVVEVGFRNQIDTGLAGKSSGTSEVALEGTEWKVRTETELNTKNGVVKWYLRIVDEATVDGWPESAYDGFLPPNDDKHSGEGYIRYKVKVRDDAPMAARIDAAATIVFDYNEPITTSPAWFNWVNADGTLAETGVLTWDGVEGASYEVSIWSGDPDAESENAVAAANSGALAENRWRIPSNLAEGTTYFWRVATTDAEGNVTLGPVWGFELGGRFRYELMPGWNLVSVPFEPEAYTARQMMRHNLFALQDGGYVKAGALEPGKAYWVFQYDNDRQYVDLLPTGTRMHQSMELHDGWNLVGSTETDTTVDGACTVWMFSEGEWLPMEAGADALYHLEAGQGYFIYQE